METTFIYALTEPGTRIIRYFGKSGNPKDRCFRHIRKAKKGGNWHVSCWIRKLLSAGRLPDVHVLCEVPKNDFERFERAFITLGRQHDFDLTNILDGGDCGPDLRGEKNPMFGGGAKHPNFGKRHSLETLAKMSAAQSGNKHPLYGKRGEKNPNFGSKRSPETRAKLSASASKRVGEKNSNFGKKHSPEALAKMSEARKIFWKLKRETNR